MTELFKVIRAGPAFSLQGKPRVGLAKFGIPPGGPMDPYSADKARQLAKSSRSAPVVEIGYGACTLQVLRPMWIAHYGGLKCRQIPAGRGQWIAEGTNLDFLPGSGMWSYLAIDGQLDGESEWQSISKRYDGQSDFKLHGQLSRNVESSLAARFFQESPVPLADRDPVFTIHSGPHMNHFPEDAIIKIATEPWEISLTSNRNGYRLKGPELNCDMEINSMPNLVGSLQVPPSGEVIITLNDGPTSGGYPVIGVLDPEQIHHLAQRRPGENIYFNWYESTTS